MSLVSLPWRRPQPPRPRIARILGAVLAACGSLALAGCGPNGLNFGSSESATAVPTTPVQSQPLGGPTAGEVIGAGATRVGLILPMTQNGGPSAIGTSLRNAAALAVQESGGSDITLMVEDDRSTPDGAAQATQAALGAGAELIIGPLFAPGVREAGRVAKGAGKSVIAFSTDAGVASHGVYLLSFLIEGYVDRIMDFAKSRGKKSFAVLAPQNDFGNVAVGEFQRNSSRLDVTVVTVIRYPPGQASSVASQLSAVSNQVDALFIGEQADAMPAVSDALAASGVKTQILGTGVWNDARTLRLPALQGAWFAAPDNSGFSAFAERYRAKFNSDPTRLSTLSYDAVSLAAALARTQGADKFSDRVLTNPSGFNGADGVFRFRADGLSERGLAIMQIGNGAASLIAPAARSFAGG